MRWLTLILGVLLSGPALADLIIATRTIRPQEILGPSDLLLQEGADQSNVTLEDLIGQEARVALYAGRPVRPGDVGPPAVVERNQVVPLIYLRGGLEIMTEGRSLDRAGIGDHVRVMNLASRATVSGRVTASGRILVSQ
ncbi:flagella basal body P-ring formation protein FlgA [Roseovarius mucosus DSM 17069]|uniref:Flagella basal body P-ring formation protein FlgA n=1 Tax=Roseovarius mucosus DSM 17069 TaxID=1288298 RepID=A0A0A0HRS4_9RHOB|nr:flagellar basal body P-ring formation chaperone FlgA [Roseovarius mucosus]KGM89970.1 flagella basal body P-ring formation protein FlgA [Roseovarius mucosus DSM 17069]